MKKSNKLPEVITSENAVKLIKQTNGQIFTVEFLKKDRTVRIMNCRLGVKKHLKGGEMKYDPSEYEMLPVFDVQKQDYRMIALDTIQKVTVDGRTYAVI